MQKKRIFVENEKAFSHGDFLGKWISEKELDDYIPNGYIITNVRHTNRRISDIYKKYYARKNKGGK